MMKTSVHFDTYTKTVFTENRSLGNKRNKLELNQQHYQVLDEEQSQRSLSTIRLVYNTGFKIDPTYYESLLPLTAAWQNSDDHQIDPAFTELSQSFEQFTLGKSLRRWQEEIPGFGPCLAFNASHKTSSQLYLTIETLILNHGLTIGGQRYRIIDRGIGFYLGPKGQTKNIQRQSPESHPVSDPLSDINRSTYKNEINLDFRFALASADDNNSAVLTEYEFYHGRHPMISFSLNVHLEPNSKYHTKLSGWSDIEQNISTHVEHFRDFIVRNLPDNRILQPNNFKHSGHWSKADAVMQRSHKPNMEIFTDQTFNADQDLKTLTHIKNLNQITTEFISQKYDKKQTPLCSAEPGMNRTDFFYVDTKHKNPFSALSVDSSDEESSDEETSTSTITQSH